MSSRVAFAPPHLQNPPCLLPNCKLEEGRLGDEVRLEGKLASLRTNPTNHPFSFGISRNRAMRYEPQLVDSESSNELSVAFCVRIDD